MGIRFALAAALVAAVLQTFAAQQPAQEPPPERPFGKGIIEVRVTRPDMTEGIPDVAVTLQGPTGGATADQVSQLFTPSSSLSAAQRQQVDQLFQTGFDAGVPAETIANAMGRLQAQLLGQAVPTTLPAPAQPRAPANITLLTDTDGRVNFPSLPSGRYSIRAQRDGYYGTQTQPGATDPSTTVGGTVTLKDSDDAPARLAFAMMRGVVLGGRVRGPDDRPVAGIIVSAQQPVYQNGRTVLNAINQSQTDDRGVFRIFWLPPGDYYLSATPRPRTVAASPQDTWAKTFFPGVVDARVAAPVTAAEGAELNGIDFAIQAEAIGRISGRIISPFKGANGKPTTPAPTLYLIPHVPFGLSETSVLNFQNVAQEKSNGEFEIRSILPGVYDLMASAPTDAPNPSGTAAVLNGGTVINFNEAAPAATAWGRVRVDVGKEALTNVTIAIKAGLEIKVRVTMDGAPPPFTMAAPPQRSSINGTVVEALIARGVPSNDAIAATRAAANAGLPAQVPTPRVRLSLQPKEANAPAASATSQASFDPSGLYVFSSVPPGNYRVQIAQLPAPEAYVADIHLGGTSIYDDGLLINGPLPGDIEVTIVSKGSRLQGTVANVENRPAANAAVALIPAETRRHNPALYKTTRTNATGGFTLNGVAPGIYKLFALEDAQNGAWQSADFLSRYEQLGEPVTIMGGESLNTTLKLIPKNYGR